MRRSIWVEHSGGTEAATTAGGASRPTSRDHASHNPADQWMQCVKLLGQRPMARDFDRQVTEVQVRVAILDGRTALGIPITKAVG